jgi:hypothetical protein
MSERARERLDCVSTESVSMHTILMFVGIICLISSFQGKYEHERRSAMMRIHDLARRLRSVIYVYLYLTTYLYLNLYLLLDGQIVR